MSKYHPIAAVGALVGALAVSTAIPRLSAQDTSGTGQTGRDSSAQIQPATPDTSGYSGMRRDTTGQGNAQPAIQPTSPGRLGDSSGTPETNPGQTTIVDSSASPTRQQAQVWYAPSRDSTGAADTTKAGKAKARKHKTPPSRIHPADSAAAAQPGAATPNGPADTSGMGGRRSGDSTLPGSNQSPRGQTQPDTVSDSGRVSGP